MSINVHSAQLHMSPCICVFSSPLPGVSFSRKRQNRHAIHSQLFTLLSVSSLSSLVEMNIFFTFLATLRFIAGETDLFCASRVKHCTLSRPHRRRRRRRRRSIHLHTLERAERTNCTNDLHSNLIFYHFNFQLHGLVPFYPLYFITGSE